MATEPKVPDPSWPAVQALAKYGDDVPERPPDELSLSAWVLWYGNLQSGPWTRKRIEGAISLCTPPATWRQLHKEARTALVDGHRVDRPDEARLRPRRVWLEGALQWTYAAAHQWRVWDRKHERACRSGDTCPTLKLPLYSKKRAARLRKLRHGYCPTCAMRQLRTERRATHAV